MSTDKQNSENELAMAILNGLSGPNACKGADERLRMIPLHIADAAVAACEKEIQELRAENARLRKLFADTDRLMLLDGEYEAAKVGTYARLKAEVERLRNLGIKLDGYVDLLQGENERLRKAGDALYSRYLCSGCSECEGMYDDSKVLDEWNAAKEGKTK